MVAVLTACQERASSTREVATLTASSSDRTDTSEPKPPRPEIGWPGDVPGEHPVYRIPPKRKPGDPEPDPAVRPRLIKSVPPEYTDTALKQLIQGVVVLELTIERDGRVSSGRVLKPLPSGLTQKAIDAVEHWRYEPGKDERGNPVRCSLIVMVQFKPPDPRRR